MIRNLIKIITISFCLLFGFLNQTLASQNSYTIASAELADSLTDEEKATSMLQTIIKGDRYISTIDDLTTIELPIGIASNKSRDKDKYAIIIERLFVDEGDTYITAYMVFTVPGTETRIIFKGERIPLSFSGGLQGIANLFLVNDVDVNFTPEITLRFIGNKQTSVSFDCNGYVEMKITADLLFDSETFKLENDAGKVIPGQMKTRISATFADWNDATYSLSLPPFQHVDLEGFGFKVSNATLDMSDSYNPNNIVFPEEYETKLFNGMDHNIWSGVFIQDVQIRMPPEFKSTKTTQVDDTTVRVDSIYQRVSFYGENLIIDDLGFTGIVGIRDLIAIDEGDMDSWQFSVSQLSFEFTMSNFTGAAFEGLIHPKGFEEEDYLGYKANIGIGGSYNFQVSTFSTLTLDIFSAKLNITQGSYVGVDIKDDSFVPSLHLNGVLAFNASTEKDDKSSSSLSISDIPFEGMHIQTIEPYFAIDKISFGVDVMSFGNFPININHIGIAIDHDRVGVQFGLTVNFTSEGDGGFVGDGDFTVWGKVTKDDWVYDGLDVDKIAIDISKEDAFSIKGSIQFMRGDSIYGRGFRGDVAIEIASFEMEGIVIFGTVNKYRYWFADIMLTLSTGIPAGPISIYGFGGGAYSHMKQAPAAEAGGSAEFGKSLSGLTYIPDKSLALGIRAAVKFALSSGESTFNGDVELGIEFNSSGGVNKIYFKGNGYFATGQFASSESETKANAEKMSNGEDVPLNDENAQIWATIYMAFDFPNKSFHCDFSAYVDIAGGVVKGGGPGGRMGWGIIHFDPVDWYIYLGTPDDPNSIEVLNIAKLDNYFMAGKTIPDLPSPPDQVLSVLSQNGKTFKADNATGLGDGGGFMFGASIMMDTGKKKFLIFYGEFGLGIGFDILMKKYGNDAICLQTNKRVGVNGWYAQGQAWAWIKAEIGIEVDLLFVSGSFAILDMEVAALLQTKLPNPFWMKANVAGRYNILGGLVKGDCDFELEIGEQCTLKAAPPISGVDIIADVQPQNSGKDIDVFSTPQVMFNLPIGPTFSLKNEQTNKYIDYKLEIDTYSFIDKDQNEVEGDITWNEEKDVMVFKPHNILQGNTEYTLYIKIKTLEKQKNVWQQVRLNSGELYYESRNTVFTTGNAPDYIPDHNVAFVFPQRNQLNYHPGENYQNYLTLKSGQRELFTTEGWKQSIRITSLKNNTTFNAELTYMDSEKTITFATPPNLPTNTIYKLEIVNTPTTQAAEIDANKVENYTETDYGGSTASVKNVSADGIRVEHQEKIIYSFNFRTSNYKTLSEKLRFIENNNSIVTSAIYPRVHEVYQYFWTEPLDKLEMSGANRMIRLMPVLEKTSWFKNDIQPIITFPTTFVKQYNLPVFEATEDMTTLRQFYKFATLSEADIANATSYTFEKREQFLYYNVAIEIENYMFKLKTACANLHVEDVEMQQKIKNVLFYNAKPLRLGTYPVEINYYLPGSETARPSGTLHMNLTEL